VTETIDGHDDLCDVLDELLTASSFSAMTRRTECSGVLKRLTNSQVSANELVEDLGEDSSG
jgi:hypothetical protein